MTILINPGVRTLLWLADPPRFYEVQLDEHGEYVYDADGAHVRTGRVIKGMKARKLMEELQRVRRIERDPRDGHEIEILGKLPKNWIFDEAWEFGFKWKRDAAGQMIGERPQDRGRAPIPLPRDQAGTIRKGRRHQVDSSIRRITPADTMDLVHVTWWKKRYPDIPYRRLSTEYTFSIDTLFRQDVPKDDAEVILLSCVGEFLDITNGDSLPSPERPIILSR